METEDKVRSIPAGWLHSTCYRRGKAFPYLLLFSSCAEHGTEEACNCRHDSFVSQVCSPPMTVVFCQMNCMCSLISLNFKPLRQF